MSGSGKSTVLAVLQARGHRVVDLDDSGWSYEQASPSGGIEQVWDEERVAAALEDPDPRPLVLAGCATNQGRFYGALDAVLLLDVPDAVMWQRLATRTTNRFGTTPEDRARIADDSATVLPQLRRTSTAILDATAAPEAVADAVEQHLVP